MASAAFVSEDSLKTLSDIWRENGLEVPSRDTGPGPDDLYRDRFVAFHVHGGVPLDDFGKSFVEQYLKPMTIGDVSAMRVTKATGALADVGGLAARTDGDPKREGLFQRLQPSDQRAVVDVTHSSLYNARYATAHGKYCIKGLLPRDDLALWGLMTTVSIDPDSNPLKFPTAKRFEKLVRVLQFRPEASSLARCFARAVAVGQYAVSHVFNYRNPESLTFHLKYLYECMKHMYSRLFNATQMLSSESDKQLVLQMLPDAVCERARLPPNETGVYFSERFVRTMEAALETIYNSFCECRECLERRSDAVASSLAVPVRAKRKRPLNSRMPRFEENYVTVRGHEKLGVLRLPKLRHIDPRDQQRICRKIHEDLFYDGWKTGWFDSSTVVPVSDRCRASTERGYVMHIASNVCMLHSLMMALRAVILSEARDYAALMERCKDELVERCTEAMSMFHGTEFSDATRRRLAELQRCRRQLKKITCGDGQDVRFFSALCDILEAGERLSDYRDLPETEARKDVLRHFYRIERVYENPPGYRTVGENFLCHYIREGDVGPMNAAAIRNLGIDLCNGRVIEARDIRTSWVYCSNHITGNKFPVETRAVSCLSNMHLRRRELAAQGRGIEVFAVPRKSVIVHTSMYA
uniref:Protein UL27 n=1 Tax=Cardioderma bat herpesvirus TaxID=3141914 RepID=A0AAU7E1L9_9VIRU